MRKLFAFLVIMLPLILIVYSCSESTTPLETINNDDEQLEKGGWYHGSAGNIVVTNRSSGSISVIDTKIDEVTGTYQLPAGPNNPEPMYVVFDKRSQRAFVGDRANNQVVVFRATDFSVETTIPVGQGVFHMWADKLGKQLWVNNDIDNTTSVIDLGSLQVIATVPTPADLVSMGGKPHDVFLGPFGRLAWRWACSAPRGSRMVLGPAQPGDHRESLRSLDRPKTCHRPRLRHLRRRTEQGCHRRTPPLVVSGFRNVYE